MRKLGSASIVALVLVLAACGSSSKSSSDSGSGSGSALSKADWISQSDAICKDIDAKTSGGPKTQDAKGLSDFLATTIAAASDARTKLAALKPPSDGEQLQKDFLATVDSSLAAAKKAKTDADAGNVPKASSDLDAVDTKALNAKLKAYGFNDCAKDG